MSPTEDKPVQIGALAKSLGITTRTIRYYEEIGLMGKTDRLGGEPGAITGMIFSVSSLS
ncbi:MerR family DNA-binding transcriptional regulator [Desulfomarina profundi]|nr:MerR family DNA-binding transcriptional regulator [Desulfomarina profundi]